VRVAVCVKHAIDEAELKVDNEGKPLLVGAVSKMSTFDKNGVEEALRLRGGSGEVVVFCVGIPDAKKTIREALAMGADRAEHIVCDPTSLDSLATSALLAAAIERSGKFDFVICSEGSSDTYTGQVPPMLAERLGLPYVGYARKVEVSGPKARVERALENSVEVVESPVPMALSVVSEINEPRYPTLIQIMQASKKPTEDLTPEALGPGGKVAGSWVLGMKAQAMERKRVVFEGTAEETAAKLVEALSNEGILPR
jgi:electron transfer flavoprotein beta subunit